MAKIVGIGESVLDIVFRGDQPVAAVPGGSTFNAIISLGRTAGRRFADVPVVMVTQTGDDRVADIVTSFMGKNGVSTAGVTRLPGTQSTVSLALLDENNNAGYEFFRDPAQKGFLAGDVTFEKGDIVIFGSFFAVSPSTGEQVRKIVRAAGEAGAIVYYDINFRKNHLADLPRTRGAIEENCRLSDIVRGSDEDINAVFGSSDAVMVYERYMSGMCRNFICTRGCNSTEVFSPGVRRSFDVQSIETVSTIGAGDNFNAGIVYGMLENGFDPARVRSLENEDWRYLVPRAHLFSAEVCRSIYNYVGEDFADRL